VKSPGFAAITVGSLALGIGGSAAMYSVIYGVILNPFIYKDVDRLVSVQVMDSRGRSNGSYYTIDQFVEIAERNAVFSGVVASTWSDVTMTSEGDPQRLRGNHCTMNTFEVMGVAPLIGRGTMADDERPGAAPVVVLGYKFWQRQFGGGRTAIGRKLTLNGKVRTVIGVMPKRFMWRGADVYLPDAFQRGRDVEDVHEVHLLGRLKPGVSEAQAAAGLEPIIADLAQARPGDFPEKRVIQLRTFKKTFPSDITEALWILFGAVGVLLLISCVNVSGMLLSRMAARHREMAIRSAVGASRARLAGQLFSETLVLALCGGALGVLAAYGGLRGIIAMVPSNTIPDEAEISLNAPVLWFTLGLSVVAAMMVGLAPALQFSGRDIMSSLKEAGRTMAGGRQRVLRSLLVAGEVALSVMLLVGASLMIRTLISIQSSDLGIRRESILTLRVPFSRERYPDADRRNAFLQEAVRRIDAVPGVAAAGVNAGMPPVYNWTLPVEIAGAASRDTSRVMLQQVNEEYAKALGLAIVRGRFLSAAEVDAKVHNAVVNQAFAKRYGDLGAVARLPMLRRAPANLADDSFQIVGVVRDTMNRISTRETLPEIYIPYTVAGLADRFYVLGSVRPDSLERAVREQIYAVDRGQPVMEVTTLEEMLSDNVYARPRFNLLLFGVFAGLGLVLALVGVHGVISNSVAQRTREIGIRLALGAGYGQVIGMVLRAATQLLAIGVAVGVVGSVASARVLKGLVQNVSTIDWISLAGVITLLFATGLMASFWPALRATRVDPVQALREE
jgi:putative ABC transport system permease protein